MGSDVSQGISDVGDDVGDAWDDVSSGVQTAYNDVSDGISSAANSAYNWYCKNHALYALTTDLLTISLLSADCMQSTISCCLGLISITIVVGVKPWTRVASV